MVLSQSSLVIAAIVFAASDDDATEGSTDSGEHDVGSDAKECTADYDRDTQPMAIERRQKEAH